MTTPVSNVTIARPASAFKPTELSKSLPGRTDKSAALPEEGFRQALERAQSAKPPARKFQANHRQKTDGPRGEHADAPAVEKANASRPEEAPAEATSEADEVEDKKPVDEKNPDVSKSDASIQPPTNAGALAQPVATVEADPDFKPTNETPAAQGAKVTSVNALGAAATSEAPAAETNPAESGGTPANANSAAATQLASVDADASDASVDPPAKPAHEPEVENTPGASPVDALLNTPAPSAKANGHDVAPPPAVPLPPEVRFAEDNLPKVISGVTGHLLPNGGTMHLRLDPPEMGALTVSIHIDNGVVEASFQTTNDQATQLLGHSLSQLKTALENAGVSVDKLNVSQVPADQQTGSNDPNGQQNSQQSQEDARQFQQEQQRREVMKRMWRKLSGSDDLDMVA